MTIDWVPKFGVEKLTLTRSLFFLFIIVHAVRLRPTLTFMFNKNKGENFVHTNRKGGVRSLLSRTCVVVIPLRYIASSTGVDKIPMRRLSQANPKRLGGYRTSRGHSAHSSSLTLTFIASLFRNVRHYLTWLDLDITLLIS